MSEKWEFDELIAVYIEGVEDTFRGWQKTYLITFEFEHFAKKKTDSPPNDAEGDRPVL
jgi:hypothetical protein